MTRAMVWLGGIALLGATASDVVSVFGRSIGTPLLGTIELSQLAILVAGSLALVAAVLNRNYARVHLIIDRLSPAAKAGALRLTALMTALFFASLLAGSLWIAGDLWSAHEVSEVLGVPWRWMRAFANLCLACAVVVLLRQVWGRGR